MRILINAICAKRKSGGGFQIALNFVRTALQKKDTEHLFYVLASDELADSLGYKESDYFFIIPTQPNLRTYFPVRRRLKEIERKVCPNVVYSLVAPSYYSFAAMEVMRVTNPWVLHPNDYAKNRLSFLESIRNNIYCMIQKYLIRKCKYFITQTEYSKSFLKKVARVSDTNICAISNVLPAVFIQMDNTHIEDQKWVNITCISAPYPHKNLDIIPDVLLSLINNFHITNVRFHVTLPEDSKVWKCIKSKLNTYNLTTNVVNHGHLTQTQLCDLYRRSQLMFLPTLLEVFSASILEAMYFNLAIVASDFKFNSDVIGDAGLLFEPTNPIDASEKIASIIKNKELSAALSRKMKERIKLFIDYDCHFNQSVDFLTKVARIN